MKLFKIALVFVPIVMQTNLYAFNLPDSSDSSSLRTDRLCLVTAGAAGLVTIAHVQNYNSWWKGERDRFRFREEAPYLLGADKLGHLYFTSINSDLVYRSMLWAGAAKNEALWYGTAASIGLQLYVEVEDGFTKSLGFSLGDVMADLIGAFYPRIRESSDLFRHTNLKWSCYPSQRYRSGDFRTVIDDYESMYFWLSIGHDMFPDAIKKITPGFLSLAIGYSVKKVGPGYPGEKEIFLSLDYDLTRLPGDGAFLRQLKYLLNYIHLPAPAVRIAPTMIWYGIHF